MKMSRKYKHIALACALGTALCATTANAANYTKSLKALYKNISVTYNGAAKTLSSEPFVVDAVTYVPLRSVSEIMGASVDWNGSTNMITITNSNTGSSADLTSLQQQLASANYQVTTLQRELEQTKAELDTYKNNSSSSSSSSTAVTSGTTITSAELTATENYLTKTYSDELDDDINLDFDLSKKGSRLDLTISYSTSSEEKAYNKLKEKTITNFLQDVCDDIAARHANINIEGVINYEKNDTDKASFSYAYKNSRLTVDYGLTEDEVEEIIWDTRTKLTLPVVGTTSIKNVSSTVNKSNSSLIFSIYMNSASLTTENWKEYVGEYTGTLRNEFKEIKNAIADEDSSFDIDGELYTSDGTLIGTYDGSANTLTLKTLK